MELLGRYWGYAFGCIASPTRQPDYDHALQQIPSPAKVPDTRLLVVDNATAEFDAASDGAARQQDLFPRPDDAPHFVDVATGRLGLNTESA